MKQFLILALILALCLSMTGCGTQNAAENEPTAQPQEEQPLAGGWSMADSAELSPELRAAFDSAMDGLVGVSYEPLKHLADQVVAGMNHAILCRAQGVYPDAQPYYAIVFLYEDLSGKAELSRILSLTPSGRLDENAGSAMRLMGGWNAADNQEGGLAALAKADASLVPVWVLGQQVVAGMNDCVLCRDAEGYTLATVYEDLKGGAEITGTTDLWGAVLQALETVE